MANQVNTPTKATLSMKQLEAKERGWIGVVFGTKDHAPTNIGSVAPPGGNDVLPTGARCHRRQHGNRIAERDHLHHRPHVWAE
jgi:hypothetical protein